MRKGIFTLLALLIISSTVLGTSVTVINPPPTNEPDPVAVRAAVMTLKNMPRKERKEKLKLAKKELKAFKAAKKAGKEPDTNTILLVILAIIFFVVALVKGL